mgnify:CR=1 FL=1
MQLLVCVSAKELETSIVLHNYTGVEPLTCELIPESDERLAHLCACLLVHYHYIVLLALWSQREVKSVGRTQQQKERE